MVHPVKSHMLAFALFGLAAALPANAATIYGSDLTLPNPGASLTNINPATGAAAAIGVITGPSQLDGLAFDSNTGTLYGVDTVTNDLYRVDKTTGVATSIGDLGVNPLSMGLTFDINKNVLYMTSSNTATGLYSVNPTTAVATAIGSGFGGIGVDALGFDPNSSRLYGIGTLAGTRSLYLIDTVLGTLSLIGALGAAWGGGSAGADYDAVNNILYAVNSFDDKLFTINTSTGVATAVGPLGYGGTFGLAVDSGRATVPLPAALPLLLSAIGGLGVFGWRRHRAMA